MKKDKKCTDIEGSRERETITQEFKQKNIETHLFTGIFTCTV